MARIANFTTAGVPVDPTGGMTLDALMLRQKMLADRAGDIAAPRQMVSPWQGAAQLAQTFVNSRQEANTADQLAAGRDALAKIRAGINLDTGPTAEQISQASLYDPGYADNLTQMAAQAIQARRAQEAAIANREDTQTFTHGENVANRQAEIDAARARAVTEASQPQTGQAKLAADLAAGRIDKPTYDAALAKENAMPGSGVTVYTGDTSSALTKKFDEKEGERWDTYVEAGSKAAALTNDMRLLDELGKVAPQGPVPGAIAKIFPHATSAGAAYQSIINRVAPSLRVTGSGSTSDIEYKGMLDSLPNLGNYPEANQLIGAMIKAKAGIDLQRADIVTKWRNGEIKDAEARTQLGALNRQSIMTPELQALISQTAPAGAEGTAASAGDLTGMSDADLDAEIARRRAAGGQ